MSLKEFDRLVVFSVILFSLGYVAHAINDATPWWWVHLIVLTLSALVIVVLVLFLGRWLRGRNQ